MINHPFGKCPIPYCEHCETLHFPGECDCGAACECDMPPESQAESSVCQGRGCGGCTDCMDDDDVITGGRPPSKRPRVPHISDYPDCEAVGVLFRLVEIRKRAAGGLGFETIRTLIPRNCSNPAHGHYVIHTYIHAPGGVVVYEKA